MNLPTTTPNDRNLAWYVRECESLDDRNRVLAAEVDQWAARCAAAIYMLPETVTGGQLREAQDKFHRERENLRRENAALRAERDAARKLLDTHVLRSDLFGYLAWLEDHRDHGDIDLKRADYLILASDGTTCWGKTFMEAVQVAEQHDRELFDAARKEAQP